MSIVSFIALSLKADKRTGLVDLRIFFGVQATGNGHLTRSRIIAKHLAQAGAKVDYLVSGRERSKLFDMEVFGDYLYRRGLTFEVKDGRVQPFRSALKAGFRQFRAEVRSLDLSGYDLVISDYEPVTSWAARRQGKRVIGISHQYAFAYAIPKANSNKIALKFLQKFAPVNLGLGIHWHHFGQPIVPPIIESNIGSVAVKPNKYLVYMAFEDVDAMVKLLNNFPRCQFVFYSPLVTDENKEPKGNVLLRKPSLQGFRSDFADSAGIFCNAGFELPSEALQAGKRLIVKPLRGQVEQLSNAVALEQLGYAQTMTDFDVDAIGNWLEQDAAIKITFPDVGKAVAQWILDGAQEISKAWTEKMWAQTTVSLVSKS